MYVCMYVCMLYALMYIYMHFFLQMDMHVLHIVYVIKSEVHMLNKLIITP
jgi:hypothetical protein